MRVRGADSHSTSPVPLEIPSNSLAFSEIQWSQLSGAYLAKSCFDIQNDCANCTDDGGTGCETLAALASCGTAGKHKQNIERDLISRIRRLLEIPLEPLEVSVLALDADTGKTKDNIAYVICPHEVFKTLFDAGPELFFDRLGTPDQWEEYWLLHKCETWFLEHLLRDQILAAPRSFCPALGHSDDAQQSKRVGKTIKLSSWCSPVAKNLDCRASRFPIFVTSNVDPLHRSAEYRLDGAAAWSFTAAADGFHPDRHYTRSEDLDPKRRELLA